MANPAPLRRGKTYHIYSRGVNRENLFVEERNYRYFLQLYARHVAPIADTYAYCLLGNHFHVLVRIKQLAELSDPAGAKEPSQRFSNLLNAYTKALYKTYGRTGTLFQRPFGRVEVTSNAYFARLVVYIHQNAQKHGLVDDFRDWPYSSYQAHLSEKPTQVDRDEVLGWFDGRQSFAMAHRQEADMRRLAALVAEDFE
jgi:REP element-mobilizing transposase RayT